LWIGRKPYLKTSFSPSRRTFYRLLFGYYSAIFFTIILDIIFAIISTSPDYYFAQAGFIEFFLSCPRTYKHTHFQFSAAAFNFFPAFQRFAGEP
jgi:hypothetical protein